MSLVRTALGLFLLGGVALGQPQAVLSHIAAGGGWSTDITLVNRSQTAMAGYMTVSFYDSAGLPLNLHLTTTHEGKSQTITNTFLSIFVGWNETLVISTGDQVHATVVGWVEIRSEIRGGNEVGGFAIFRYTPERGSPSEGTVPLQAQSQFSSSLTLPFDNTNGFVMGVALANSTPLGLDITVTILDDGGRILGTQNIHMSGLRHLSFVLPDLIPLTAGKRGMVQFNGSNRISGLGLRFSPFGTFTSVPAI